MKSIALTSLMLAATIAPNAVLAGSSVSPTRLSFARTHVSDNIVITNTEASSKRYSVAAYRWDETDTDPLALSETSDVVFFPGSFTTESFASQRIRIGTVGPPSEVERTFRVVVSELPSLDSVLAPAVTGLTFRTNFSIPIYLAPIAPAPAGEIESVRVDKSDLRFIVRDTGNVHFIAKRMNVTASGDAGSIFNISNSAWFVLAKRQREFVFPIPSGSCASIKTVAIDVDAQVVMLKKVVAPEHACD